MSTDDTCCSEPSARLIGLDFDIENAMKHIQRLSPTDWNEDDWTIILGQKTEVQRTLSDLDEALGHYPVTKACRDEIGTEATIQVLENVFGRYCLGVQEGATTRANWREVDMGGSHKTVDGVDLLEEYLSIVPDRNIKLKEFVDDFKSYCTVLLEACYDVASSALKEQGKDQDCRGLPSKILDAKSEMTRRNKLSASSLAYNFIPFRTLERRLWLYRNVSANHQERLLRSIWVTMQPIAFGTVYPQDRLDTRTDIKDKVQSASNALLTTLTDRAKIDSLSNSKVRDAANRVFIQECLQYGWDISRSLDGLVMGETDLP